MLSKRHPQAAWLVLAVAAFILFVQPAFGQHSMGEGHSSENPFSSLWFGILELPFLILCIVYAFLTAYQLKGGVFAQGMQYMAWGFLVMAVGHLHMQIEHFFHINLFKSLMGDYVGQIVWVVALIVTWALSGFGFYKLYKASRSS